MNKTSQAAQPPASICVLRLSAIGDTCHVLPVVRTLQTAWPQTRITWVIGTLEATLLHDVDGVEFITFDKRAGGHARQLRQLRDRRFDVLLHMHASMRANLVSRHLRAETRLGFDRARARDFQWFFTNERIDAGPRQHVLDGFFGFAQHLGVEQKTLRWDIPVSESDASYAAEVRGDARRLVILSPCSSQRARNFRNWPAQRYAQVVDYLARKYDARVVITGGPTDLERQYAADIEAMAATPVISLVGETSLKELHATIAVADAVLCPDSGPAHIATAAGTPVVGLYASSNPARTGPYLSQQWSVNRYPQAVQRYLGKSVDELRWGQRVRHPDVMDIIEVGDVTARFDALFDQD